MVATHFSPTGEIGGNLVEGIAEDVPSLEPVVTPSEALEKAVEAEGDDMEDVQFDEETDAQLVVYVEVGVLISA